MIQLENNEKFYVQQFNLLVKLTSIFSKNLVIILKEDQFIQHNIKYQ